MGFLYVIFCWLLMTFCKYYKHTKNVFCSLSRLLFFLVLILKLYMFFSPINQFTQYEHTTKAKLSYKNKKTSKGANKPLFRRKTLKEWRTLIDINLNTYYKQVQHRVERCKCKFCFVQWLTILNWKAISVHYIDLMVKYLERKQNWIAISSAQPDCA